MKKLKTYNIFINESLKNKLKGKTYDDILNNLTKSNSNEILFRSAIHGFKKGIEKSLEIGADIGFDDYAALGNSIVYNQPDLFYYLYELSINNLKEKSEKGELMNKLSTEIKELNYDTIDTIINNRYYKNYLEILRFLLDDKNTDTLIIIKRHTTPCILRGQNMVIKVFCDYVDESKIDYLDYYIKIAYSQGKYNIKKTLEDKKDKLLYKSTNESLKGKLKGKSEEDIMKNIHKLLPEQQLTMSIKYNNFNLVKHVLNKYDFHINILSGYLPYTANCGNYDIVKYFIDKGVDVNYDNGEALKWATEDGNFEISKLLIDNGADIHVEDEKSLKNACKSGNYDLVKLLLDQGADPSIDIFEPLSIARDMKNIEIQKLLIKYIDKKIHSKKVNESLRDKIKGKSGEEIAINYLKNKRYNIDDKFSLALTSSEFNRIDKKLLKNIEVEDLINAKDTRFSKNIIGTLLELINFFKLSSLINDPRNVFRLMKKYKK
jgi:ankyrin repeat protein